MLPFETTYSNRMENYFFLHYYSSTPELTDFAVTEELDSLAITYFFII